jgi:hypothetical protein
MTDRELLELAAKAAGMWPDAFTLDNDDQPIYSETLGLFRSWGSSWWNPLTDDGDALRLAVKLGMSVNMFPNDDARTECASHLQNNFVDEAWRHHADPYAATRRAIVRAAAAIGEAK